jgi:hypothetical protein
VESDSALGLKWRIDELFDDRMNGSQLVAEFFLLVFRVFNLTSQIFVGGQCLAA